MISTIFRQTRPVIYLVLIGFLTLYYWVGKAVDPDVSWNGGFAFSALGAFLLLILSIFLLGWMSNENKITEFNSMPLLFYSWSFVLLPETLSEPSVLGAQFLVMYSAYKLLSLRDDRKSVYVFYDSAFLLALATWFDPWASGFLLPLIISVFMHNRLQFRDWIALFSGLGSVALLLLCLGVLQGDAYTHFREYGVLIAGEDSRPWAQLGREHYLSWAFIALMALIAIVQIIRIGHQTSGRISPVRLIASYVFCCMLVMALNYGDSPIQVQYSFFAVGFFLARTLDAFSREKFREFFLLGLLVLPFIKLILNFFV